MVRQLKCRTIDSQIYRIGLGEHLPLPGSVPRQHLWAGLPALFVSLLLAACTSAGSSPTPAAAIVSITATPSLAPPATAAPSEQPTGAPAGGQAQAGATATLPPGTYRNPVLDREFPDPDVLQAGGAYYVFATNADGIHVQAASSTDLVHWQMLPDALPVLPAWAATDFGYTWAPDADASPSGRGYVLYYTTRFAEGYGGRQCIGAATSQNPAGPYAPAGDKPIVCQLDQGGSIDPDMFTDDDGSHYLLWKNDGNCCGGQTWIYIQKLSADGLGLEGQPAQLITTDQLWEGALVEGPAMLKHGGKYYLFYSANDFNTPRYAVGYAVAGKILGPYTKPAEPLLATTLPAGIVGPGGEDFATAGGKTYILYHAWSPGAYRDLNVNELDWQGDVPVVAGLDRDPKPLPGR